MIFFTDLTASSIPVSVIGNGQFRKSLTRACIFGNINACENEVTDSPSQTNCVGNLSNVQKSKSFSVSSCSRFGLTFSHVTIWLWSEIDVGGLTIKNSIF